MSEILEAKVQLSGTEEASTDFGQSVQRMAGAAETLADKSGLRTKQEVDQILTEAGLGPLQQIRQYTVRYRQEIEAIVKDFKNVQEEVKRHVKPKRPSWIDKFFKKFDKAMGELGVKPDAFIGDLGRATSNIVGSLIPSAGGVGGILGLMLYGVAEHQKWAAEANKFTQIFEESIRTVSSKVSAADRSAASQLANFGKDLEFRFAATRGDIEAVARSFSTSGISAGEVATKLKDAVGEEQKNIFGLTISLEKHFELAGGTVAKQATELMTKYGMSVQEAADEVTVLNFAGAKSGVGVSNFTNSIFQATSGVRMMGINVDDVAALTLKLQKQYEDLGLSKHFAGAQAMQGVQQILSGIQGFGVGEQVVLAERLGMGKGLEARQRLLSQLISEHGATPEMTAQTITELRSLALEMTHGDPTQARFYLEQKLGFSGAKAVMDIGDKLASGLKLEQLSAAEKKELAGALKTEEQKTEDFQRATRDILRGMAEVGMAIFNILTAGLAELILSIRMVIAMLKGDQAGAAAYGKAMADTAGIFPKAMDDALKGLGHIGEAASEINLEGLNMLSDAFKGMGAAPAPTDPIGEVDTSTGRRLAESTGEGVGEGDPTTVGGVNEETRRMLAEAQAATPAGGAGGGATGARTRRVQPVIDFGETGVAHAQVHGMSEVVESAQKSRSGRTGRRRNR